MSEAHTPTEPHDTEHGRWWSSDRGTSLIELLVVTLMLLLLLGAAVPVLTASLKEEPKITKRTYQVQRARVAVERLARELRAGYAIDVAEPSRLVFRTYTRRQFCGNVAILAASSPPTKCRVTYTCSAGTCAREERDETGAIGGSDGILTGLSSSDVFSYSPNPDDPNYVRVRFVFPAAGGDDAITLDDGIDLRNVLQGA